jgi:hypothetical protein
MAPTRTSHGLLETNHMEIEASADQPSSTTPRPPAHGAHGLVCFLNDLAWNNAHMDVVLPDARLQVIAFAFGFQSLGRPII